MVAPYFAVGTTPLFRSKPLKKDGLIYNLNDADSIKFVLRPPSWKVRADDVVKDATPVDAAAGIAAYQALPTDLNAKGTWQGYFRAIESGGAIVLETRPFSFEVAA